MYFVGRKLSHTTTFTKYLQVTRADQGKTKAWEKELEDI